MKRLQRFFSSRVRLATTLALLVMLWCAVSVRLTDNVAYVTAVQAAVGPLGIVTAILLGLSISGLVMAPGPVFNPRPAPLPRATPVVFLVLAPILGLLAYRSQLGWLWVACGVVLGSAAVALYYVRTKRPVPAGLRYLLMTAAFAGGAVPGFMVYVIVAIIVSERYCQLTSSKCL
jgi:hypothetical protein